MNLSGWEMLLIFLLCPGTLAVVFGGGYLVVRLAVKHGTKDAQRNQPK